MDPARNLQQDTGLQSAVYAEGTRIVRQSCPKLQYRKIQNVVSVWLSGFQSARQLHLQTGIALETATKCAKALKEWTPREPTLRRGKAELQEMVDKALDVVDKDLESGKLHRDAEKYLTQAAKLGGHYEPERKIVEQRVELQAISEIRVLGGLEGVQLARLAVQERLAAVTRGAPDPLGLPAATDQSSPDTEGLLPSLLGGEEQEE